MSTIQVLDKDGNPVTITINDTPSTSTLQSTGNTSLASILAGLGAIGDTAWSGSGNGTNNAVLKALWTLLNGGLNLSGTLGLSAGEAIVGKVGGIVDNPESTYTRLANQTAYVANALVSNNATPANITVQALAVARVALGSFQIDRLRLLSNHTSGLDAKNFRVRLWSVAPTYTNGDGGAYAVATGYAGYLGAFIGAFEQFGDGAAAIMTPAIGSPRVKLAAGQSAYWDMQCTDAWTPNANSKTFKCIAETLQD